MAELGPAIHVFPCCTQHRRGWPAFAGHDELGSAGRDLKHLLPDDALALDAEEACVRLTKSRSGGNDADGEAVGGTRRS
jgi:hypothetical protein